MIVTKFGGTSVQDAAAIRRLVHIVAARTADRPVVVVSALARVTDALIALADATPTQDAEALHAKVEALVLRHHEVAAELGATGALPALGDTAQELRTVLTAAAGRRTTAAERDRIASCGEYWSSRLVWAAMRLAGVDAVWVDVTQVLATDGRHGRATPDPASIERNAGFLLRPLVEAGHVPVTQGFLGAAPDASVTTLGRGGSDYSAALLGAALGVERVEIWTDVSGIMTADPRIVPGAHSLPYATYDEAAELATFGAKVLHPATAMPLVERGIPILVRNTFAPDHPGTVIRRDAPTDEADGSVRSVTMKRGITVINIRMPRMLGAYGVLREIFEVFERFETSVDVLASSEVSVSVTIDDTAHLAQLLRELGRVAEVSAFEGRAIVAIVGAALRRAPGVAARAFAALVPLNVELVSQGASATNMTFVLVERDAPEAVRRLHTEFFGAPA